MILLEFFCLRIFLSKYAKIHPSRTDKLMLYGLSGDGVLSWKHDLCSEVITYSCSHSLHILIIDYFFFLLSQLQTMDLNLLLSPVWISSWFSAVSFLIYRQTAVMAHK